MAKLEISNHLGVNEKKECIVIVHSWTNINAYSAGLWGVQQANDLKAYNNCVAVFHVHPKN